MDVSGPIRESGETPRVPDCGVLDGAVVDAVEGTAGSCARVGWAGAHSTLASARSRTAALMRGPLAGTVAVAPNRNLLTSQARRAHAGDYAVGQRLGNVHQ